MLEEALRNEKSQPAETALAMLSFLQSELPAGGTAAELRFVKMYGILCERIFGTIGGKQDNYRHKDGGWLSAQTAWARPSSANSTGISAGGDSPRSKVGQQISKVAASRGTAPTTTLDSDPVFKLLGTAVQVPGREPPPPTLMEAISKESENRPGVVFAFPFLALPQSLQVVWLTVIEASMGGMPLDNDTATMMMISENDQRVLTKMLRKRPEEQNQLRLYKQRAAQQNQQHSHVRQPLHLSPHGIHSNSPAVTLRRPPSPSPITGSATKNIPEEDAPPSVMLSMLEYYLFLFLRFPLAPPDRSKSAATSIPGVQVHRIPTTGNVRSREPYGDTLYFQLFRRAMRHFLPYQPEENRSIAFSSPEYMESELFLRLVAAFWVEVRLTPTPKVVQTIRERRGLTTSAATNDSNEPQQPALQLDLNASYDLVVLQKYEPPPFMVHKCIRALVVHAILDPAIRGQCRQDSLLATGSTTCLSTCLTTLQQPVYNYIRTSFRYSSIHAKGSSFFGAMNVWMIWLEPWNLTQSNRMNEISKNATQRIMGSGSSEPKTEAPRALSIVTNYNKPSMYDRSWEPYIAANLYMYTVPLAIFLRRARELDFSAAKFFESIQIVKRVFRVFSPEVVEAIARHLDSSSQLATALPLVRHHVEALGAFAPPEGPMSLSSLKNDMQSLLEEIDMQHLKKVRELNIVDRWIGKVEGMFGKGVVSGEEKTLETLIERAKLIAGLPVDYDILPQSSASGSTKSADQAETGRLARKENGELTDYAREQLIAGQFKCDPAEVPYRGDKMRRRVGKYEISVLVELSLWASDRLNERWGLSKDDDGTFRINLRFLADYRNTLFLVLALYLLCKIML